MTAAMVTVVAAAIVTIVAAAVVTVVAAAVVTVVVVTVVAAAIRRNGWRPQVFACFCSAPEKEGQHRRPVGAAEIAGEMHPGPGGARTGRRHG